MNDPEYITINFDFDAFPASGTARAYKSYLQKAIGKSKPDSVFAVVKITDSTIHNSNVNIRTEFGNKRMFYNENFDTSYINEDLEEDMHVVSYKNINLTATIDTIHRRYSISSVNSLCRSLDDRECTMMDSYTFELCNRRKTHMMVRPHISENARDYSISRMFRGDSNV